MNFSKRWPREKLEVCCSSFFFWLTHVSRLTADYIAHPKSPTAAVCSAWLRLYHYKSHHGRRQLEEVLSLLRCGTIRKMLYYYTLYIYSYKWDTHTDADMLANSRACLLATIHTYIYTDTQTRCLVVGHCVGQAQTGRFVCLGKGVVCWPGIQSELWNVDKTFYCTPTPTPHTTHPKTHANKSYQCALR